MLKKNLWKKSRKSRFPFHLKHQELAILKGKYSFTVYFSFTISFVFVFSCRLRHQNKLFILSRFPTKRVFNIDYKVRPFYLQDDQCDQIGQFIGLWAIFKASGNN